MAAANGIINNAAQGAKIKADTPDLSASYGVDLTQNAAVPGAANPSVLAPVASAQTGIIGGAQTTPGMSTPPATTPAPAATPASTTDYTGQIQDAYHKYLGRTGEQSGVDFYNGLLKGGMSMDRINQGFTDSDEYKALHPAAKSAASGPTLLGAPTKWDITPDQTVQGQMKNQIDPNSPYYQQWATAGAQDAAARGFTGNSSIRETGIMDSVMRGATPIATSDAATYAKAAGYNADMPNQFAIKNQEASNSNSQFNSAQQNDMAKAHLSADTQKYLAGVDAQTRLSVQKMGTDGQTAISQAQEANKVLLANNAAAQQAYLSYVAAVAQIDQNDKMTGDDAKKQAIIHQNQMFNSAMAGIKAASPGAADLYNPNDPISVSAKAQADEAARANAVAAVGDVDVGHLLDFTG